MLKADSIDLIQTIFKMCLNTHCRVYFLQTDLRFRFLRLSTIKSALIRPQGAEKHGRKVDLVVVGQAKKTEQLVGKLAEIARNQPEIPLSEVLIFLNVKTVGNYLDNYLIIAPSGGKLGRNVGDKITYKPVLKLRCCLSSDHCSRRPALPPQPVTQTERVPSPL